MPRYQIRDGKRELVAKTEPADRPAARNADGERINAAWQCSPSPRSAGATSGPEQTDTPPGDGGNPPARPGGKKKGH